MTINGGSSSIKFALFETGESLKLTLEDGIERIGLPEAEPQSANRPDSAGHANADYERV